MPRSALELMRQFVREVDARTMFDNRRLLTAVLVVCGACTSPAEPERLPAPIVNEFLVLGNPVNGRWPDWGLYAVNVTNLTPRQIGPGTAISGLAIPPDGRSILFSGWLAEEDRGYQLYRMDSDGQHIRRVTGPPVLPLAGLDRWPSWAPNGNLIAFVRDHSLMIANADGTGLRLLVDSISLRGSPSWSPDSRMLLYVGVGTGGSEDLLTIDIQSGIRRNLTNTAEQELYPDWGPDFNLVAYVGYDSLASSWQVMRLDVDTGIRRSLSHAASFPTFPKWSRSGRRIAFNLTTGPNFLGEIHAVDSGGNGGTVLAQDVRVEAPMTWGLEAQ